jgi:hypothetical protein
MGPMKYLIATIPFIFFYIAVWTAPITHSYPLSGHFAAIGGIAVGQIFVYLIIWMAEREL